MQAGSEPGQLQVFPGPGELIGQQLAERYRIEQVIGVGGMGAVYRALHVVIDKLVAVKVLSPEYSGRESDSKRFMIEAQAASRIRHPNVVDITDFGYTDDGRPYLVMEYLEGQDLESLIQDRGALCFEEACSYIEQIGAALTAAHANGVVHRDMKPENCFLVQHDGGQQIKVLDFGIAKILDDHLETGERSLTGQGLIGTPEYIAPELVRGAAPDRRVDVYALGIVLYFLLTGDVPFRSGHYMETLTQQLLEDVPPIRERLHDKSTPLAVDAVVEKCLCKDPEERYQDVPAFLAALKAAAIPQQAPPWRPSKSLIFSVLGVLLLWSAYALLPWREWFEPSPPPATGIKVATPAVEIPALAGSETDTETGAEAETEVETEVGDSTTEADIAEAATAAGGEEADGTDDDIDIVDDSDDGAVELSRAALLKQLGPVRSAIRRKCKGLGLPGMSVQVKLTVKADGSVSQAAVLGTRAGSSLGTCVVRQVKKASFDGAQQSSQHRVKFRL